MANRARDISRRPRAAVSRTPTLRSVLPPEAVHYETSGELVEVLAAEEHAVVAQAVPSRQAEFRTGRGCARRALAQLGLPPVAIPVGASREPRWPAGVVGALTHCEGYRAAAVARASDLDGLGIDAEPHCVLPDDVLTTVASPAERIALARLPESGIAWDTVLFSAKESVYKVWFPLRRTWLGFEDCTLRIDPAGTFTARIDSADASYPAQLAGRWTAYAGSTHVLTAAWLPGHG